MSTRRRRTLFALKAALSLALCSWLVARMIERDGIGLLADRIAALDVGWLAFAIALHLAAVFAGVLRWRVLLDRAAIGRPLSFLTRSFLIGRFFGAFTPSTTGLDGWRLFEVGRATGNMGASAAVIGVEKLVGVIGMAVVCAAVVPLGGGAVLGGGAFAMALAMAAGAALGLGLLSKPAWLEALAGRVPHRGVRARAQKIAGALASCRLDRKSLAVTIGIGALQHLALSAVFFATARAVGVTADFATLLAVGNAIVVAVLVPISVGGVGVRESVATALLAAAGVGSTDALLVALLGYLTGQVPALLGGLALALDRSAPRPEVAVVPARDRL